MTEVLMNVPTPDSGLTPPSRRSAPTILVVEDHSDTRDLLRYVLESHHYQVTEATDGGEAVNLAAAILPDLILMDTTLESMDGLEALRRIRSTSCTRDIAIVFLSGHAQPRARALALASGADDYLVKPVSLAELEKVVEHQLSNAHQKRKQSLPGFHNEKRELL